MFDLNSLTPAAIDTFMHLIDEVRKPEISTGSLSVLNCTIGDIRINFDKNNEEEVVRARKIIEDMLKRGYSLFIDDGQGNTDRVVGFDPVHDEYILKAMPAEKRVVVEATIHTARKTKTCAFCKEPILPESQYYLAGTTVTHVACGAPVVTRRKKSRRASLRTSRVTGVAPTAGG